MSSNSTLSHSSRQKKISMVDTNSESSSSGMIMDIAVQRNNKKSANRTRKRSSVDVANQSQTESDNYTPAPPSYPPKSDQIQKSRLIVEESDSESGTSSPSDSGNDEPVQNPPKPVIAKIPEPVQVKYVTYAITRTHNVIKNSYRYEFGQEGNTLFSAKCKRRNPKKPIVIKLGTDVHISQQGDYYLVPENSATMFYFRKFSETGTKLFTSHILHNTDNYTLPRMVTVSLTEETGLPMQTLTTRKPKMNRNGVYTLDFENRFTLASEKNAIFYNQALGRNSPNVLSIRKTNKNILEIIVVDTLPNYIVFAIGLVMFTANLGN